MEDPVTVPANFKLRSFRPAPWLPGAHAQTVGGRIVRPALPLAFRRERVETPDGDFLDLDFASASASAPAPALAPVRARAPASARWSLSPPAPAPKSAPAESAPIVLLLHGLEGSARRRYARVTYRALAALGVRAVGLNFRSCGGELNRAARFYHSGETGDMRLVLAHLADRFPNAPLGVIGFSLGGNVVLKYLADEGDGARGRLRAAAAVSVPYDLAAGARILERTAVGRLYTSYFLRTLKQKVTGKADLLASVCDLDRARRARTFFEFDDAVTAPLHGFDGATDYYRCCSSGPLLDRIRVPTLLLHADDDPFLPTAQVPRVAAEANPWIVPGFTRKGGHVGFIAGTPWAPEFWAETEAARFLEGILTA